MANAWLLVWLQLKAAASLPHSKARSARLILKKYAALGVSPARLSKSQSTCLENKALPLLNQLAFISLCALNLFCCCRRDAGAPSKSQALWCFKATFRVPMLRKLCGITRDGGSGLLLFYTDFFLLPSRQDT